MIAWLAYGKVDILDVILPAEPTLAQVRAIGNPLGLRHDDYSEAMRLTNRTLRGLATVMVTDGDSRCIGILVAKETP